jgi:Tfp pilus assembly protein PilV
MVSESIAGRLSTIFRKGVSGVPSVDDKGFTLVEVMIAIFFFMIVALALISLNSSTWYNTYFSRSTTEGSVLAAQHLEELIPSKYVSNNPDGHDGKIAPGYHSFQSGDGRHTGTYRISDDKILVNTKSVRITVTYKTHGGKTREARYNYLIPLRK